MNDNFFSNSNIFPLARIFLITICLSSGVLLAAYNVVESLPFFSPNCQLEAQLGLWFKLNPYPKGLYSFSIMNQVESPCGCLQVCIRKGREASFPRNKIAWRSWKISFNMSLYESIVNLHFFVIFI